MKKRKIDTIIKKSGAESSTTSGSTDGCEYPDYIGDDYCNDGNNYEECEWDNGDCCGTCVNVDNCSLCECLSAESGNGISNALVANGVCNDETNTINCGFDGFDCCRPNITQDYCIECSCYTSKYLLF